MYSQYTENGVSRQSTGVGHLLANFLRLKRSGNIFYVYYKVKLSDSWTAVDNYTCAWMPSTVRLGVNATCAGGGYRSHVEIEYFRDVAGEYAATSPVYYAKYDSGNDNTVWTSEKQKILANLASTDSGTVKAKFGFSNTSYGAADTATIDALLSGSWLTPDGSNEVTNPGGTGRYMYIAYQFVSDGTQQTSLALMQDDAETGVITIDTTIPTMPSITSYTVTSGQIVLTIDANAATDVVYARYRRWLNTDWDSWSAENASYKTTGDGDITITGLSNGGTYQFSAYTKTAGATSLSDSVTAGIYAPSTGSYTADSQPASTTYTPEIT